MALKFKIEPCEETIKFTVKGNEIELAYHAASALCTQIAEVLVDRLGDQTVHHYWLLRLEQKYRVNVHKHNREAYGLFLDRHGNPFLKPAPGRKKKEPQPKEDRKSIYEARKEERQRFVEYWKKRLSKYQGDTPSQSPTTGGKDAHSENKDRL